MFVKHQHQIAMDKSMVLKQNQSNENINHLGNDAIYNLVYTITEYYCIGVIIVLIIIKHSILALIHESNHILFMPT